MNDRFELLAAMPVFGGLDEATLQVLTELAEPVTVPKGEYFFHEGDETQAMYVLQSGRVEIYKTWQSASKVLRYMEPGDCFGEMALIDLFPRGASALAVEHSEALQITPAILREVYRQDKDQFAMLHMNIGREISRRLRRVDDLMFRIMMGESLPEATFNDLS